MKFIIVTGMSGAGKSQAVHCLEDIGFFCIDNMPPQLIGKFAELYSNAEKIKGIAVVCDIRSGELFESFSSTLDELTESGYDYEILFLDADNETLIKRYKETRRNHPMSGSDRIIDGITREREILEKVKNRSTHIIDTTYLKTSKLKEQINAIYNADDKSNGLLVNILSFGFKYGIPLDSDLVFDVRFLPNPYYDLTLREHTGLESCISDYVMSFHQSKEFLEKLKDMVTYLIPHYIEEGKSQLVISIGCTGGHHRSVTIAEELHKTLKDMGQNVNITHRDIHKNV